MIIHRHESVVSPSITEKKGISTEKINKIMEKGREKTEDVIIHLIVENPKITIKELSDLLSL